MLEDEGNKDCHDVWMRKHRIYGMLIEAKMRRPVVIYQ